MPALIRRQLLSGRTTFDDDVSGRKCRCHLPGASFMKSSSAFRSMVSVVTQDHCLDL